MEKFCRRILMSLCIFLAIHTTFAKLKGRLPNPGGSELLPETKEFINRLEKATSVQDIKKLQEEDDTFTVHDFSEGLRKDTAHSNKHESSSSSCKATKNEGEQTPSPDVDGSEQIEFGAKGSTEATETAHSVTLSHELHKGNGSVQQEAAAPESSSTETAAESKTTGNEDEVFELVDFGKSSDPTEPSGARGYEPLRHDHSTLAASVERQMQDPAPEQPAASDAKDSKKKRKKKAPEQSSPTKEELEASYKYEVLSPPDNSPVKLDFPASPHAQGEEHLSQHVPLTLYCDTCMAIAYQVHLAFDKFHRQVTRRLPTESEVYHLVAEACQQSRYNEYGMLEVHGHRHISGPGCNQLEAEGGVKHSRGPWPRRLADRCEEVTEDIGELTMHEAWRREQRDPERFKMFMCFGEPPRNYCQKYGHMDAAAEAAARRRSRPAPEDTETPIEAATRMAREAEEAELRRLAELADSDSEAAAGPLAVHKDEL